MSQILYAFLLPVILMISGLCAGWLKCYDATKDRLTRRGFLLLSLLIVLTCLISWHNLKTQKKLNIAIGNREAKIDANTVEISELKSEISKLNDSLDQRNDEISNLSTMLENRTAALTTLQENNEHRQRMMSRAHSIKGEIERCLTKLNYYIPKNNTRSSQITAFVKELRQHIESAKEFFVDTSELELIARNLDRAILFHTNIKSIPSNSIGTGVDHEAIKNYIFELMIELDEHIDAFRSDLYDETMSIEDDQ